MKVLHGPSGGNRAVLLFFLTLFSLWSCRSTGTVTDKTAAPEAESAAAPQAQPSTSRQAVSAPEAFEAVRDGVYEVVFPKLDESAVQYEREIPQNLIPYAIRTDAYYSVGTAFALSENSFASAAHVLSLNNRSLYPKIFLRDKDKQVYEIDQVTAYSQEKDFVVFTVKGLTARTILLTNPAPTLNETVYSVGNAFGEGIVVREGLYTSRTPDRDSGRWEWLRFSAAASPGNSGGPLLDSRARVIGLISRKSENENLNYALPISNVLEGQGRPAEIEAPTRYVLPNLRRSKEKTFSWTLDLPRPYQDFREALTGAYLVFAKGLLSELSKEAARQVFADEAQDLDFFYSPVPSFFPRTIVENDNGVLGLYEPSKINNENLGSLGRVSYGDMVGFTFFRFFAPSGLGTQALASGGKQFMDAFLKVLPFSRILGNERIRIRSLGNPSVSERHIDVYGRTWIIAAWDLPYADSRFLVCGLPTPGGMCGFIKIASTNAIEVSHKLDATYLTDYVQASYYATLPAWQDYLGAASILPPPLKDLGFSFDKGAGTLDLAVQRLSVRIGQGNPFEITEASDMSIQFLVAPGGGQPRLEVARIGLGPHYAKPSFVAIQRHTRPPRGLGSLQDRWEQLAQLSYPWNESLRQNNGNTTLAKVASRFEGQSSVLRRVFPFTYTVELTLEGTPEEAKAKELLEAFDRSGVVVLE